MSSELASRLISADSVEAFLREQNGSANWRTVSALKAEVDRLVGSDLNSAAKLAGLTEKLALLLADPVSTAFAGASRARVFHQSGDYWKANELYETAVAAMRAAKLSVEAALIQKQQIDALTQMGRYADALRIARAARRSLSRGEEVHVAQLEANVGNIYYRLDRYKKALECYDRAREILLKVGDDAMLALVDGNRSNVFIELDRHDEALALLESTAAALDAAGQNVFAAEARFHIAYLQFLRGNYNVALKAYHEVRDRLTELGSTHRVAWCNQEIAEVLLALNAFDDAAESAASARARFAELNMPYESAQATVIHALALMGQQRFEQAQSDLFAARETFTLSDNKPLTALIDAYLAELALKLCKPDEAGQYAAASLRVFSRQKLHTKSAYARLLSARAAHLAGDKAKALRMAKAALRCVEGLFCPGVVYQCHHLIGRVERARKRSPLALESFRRAVATIEKMRGGVAADEFKATFLHDKIDAYEDAIAACLDDGTGELIEEAFRLVESSKSRSLADLLARYVRETPETGSGSHLQGETRERLSKLINDLNWYSSQAGLAEDKGDQRSAELADRYRHAVARCERQITQLFRRMEIESPAFAEIQRMQPVKASDVCDALKPGEALIEYFTTGNQVSAFIATRDGLKVARAIASKSDVERSLTALRFQIEKFNYGTGYVEAYFGQLKRSANEHLAQLYKAIFAPLEDAVEDQRLIIVPHGMLHYVPFHALLGGDGYLVERFEISYAPSAAVLKLCRARRSYSNNGDTLVALGVVESGTPSIEQEIDTLERLFPKMVKLTGDQATREKLLRAAPQAKFLHLASHGYFRRDNPMFSFLKLADSQLNFYSLLDLKLNAEMVTLSACHTGLNMIFPGDELHGLMRGFLYAGAPSVVASLWAVSDNSTAEFMREMYSHIRAGATKRAALRAAQLAIKDAYGHPYYWAPFVLMGNPE